MLVLNPEDKNTTLVERGVFNSKSLLAFVSLHSHLILTFPTTDSDQPPSNCTMEYLLAMTVEMLRARSFVLTAVAQEKDFTTQLSRMEHIVHDFERLLSHPELFPSLEIYLQFIGVMNLNSEIQQAEVCRSLLLTEEAKALEEVSRNQFTRPTYIRGSKGWENFLLNLAPGAGLRPEICRPTTPKSALQILTPIAARIVGDFEREEEGIISSFNSVMVSRVGSILYHRGLTNSA